jgi:hypothetical protein
MENPSPVTTPNNALKGKKIKRMCFQPRKVNGNTEQS